VTTTQFRSQVQQTLRTRVVPLCGCTSPESAARASTTATITHRTNAYDLLIRPAAGTRTNVVSGCDRHRRREQSCQATIESVSSDGGPALGHHAQPVICTSAPAESTPRRELFVCCSIDLAERGAVFGGVRGAVLPRRLRAFPPNQVGLQDLSRHRSLSRFRPPER